VQPEEWVSDGYDELCAFVSMKRCCVIGGAGFIGYHAVEALLSQLRRVTVIGRSPVPFRKLPKGVQYICGDYGDTHFLSSILTNVDEIVDLAYSSVPGTSFENPVEDILVNLPSVVRLLDVASSFPVQKVVIMSSGGTVYGQAKCLPVAEDHPTNPISPYGVTKLAVEKYAFLFKELKGLPVVVVRPSNAFGEHQRAFSGQGFVATAIASVLEGKEIIIYGEPGAIRDYIYVTDVARGIVAALDHGVPGSCYNLGSGIGRSNKDVLEAIRPLAESVGLGLKINIATPRQFDVAANVLDSSKLMYDSGWHTEVSFAEGIKRTWNWFLKNARNSN
jgi:UDP-glucose 4-epimerase